MAAAAAVIDFPGLRVTPGDDATWTACSDEGTPRDRYYATASLSCDIGPVAAGDEVTRTFRFSADSAGPVTGTGTVRVSRQDGGSPPQPDLDPEDDSATFRWG